VQREKAVELILLALDHAEEKHPYWPEDAIHAAAVVAEESGELQQAALQFTYDRHTPAAMLTEAAQVGAMAVRFLMHSDRIAAFMRLMEDRRE